MYGFLSDRCEGGFRGIFFASLGLREQKSLITSAVHCAVRRRSPVAASFFVPPSNALAKHMFEARKPQPHVYCKLFFSAVFFTKIISPNISLRFSRPPPRRHTCTVAEIAGIWQPPAAPDFFYTYTYRSFLAPALRSIYFRGALARALGFPPSRPMKSETAFRPG